MVTRCIQTYIPSKEKDTDDHCFVKTKQKKSEQKFKM